MKILILGAAGFIGTNLTLKLAQDNFNELTLFDRNVADFKSILNRNFSNISIVRGNFSLKSDFEKLTFDQDIVYHLISTTVPTTSNQQIGEEITANVVVTANLLDACVKNKVGKVVFLSSGGTVYGEEKNMPLKEDTETYPISTYGIQKITIEKLLYLYYYLYGLDYRIIRLANPYGPYQRPNGIQGVVSTFTYKALRGESITVYGDGSVVRDFIYIDDAVEGILNIVNSNCKYKIYNLGSGKGESIKKIINTIKNTLEIKINVNYTSGRKVDAPVNILDISRYEEEFGILKPIGLTEGILRTAEFMKSAYAIV